jgi:hypothetical protein
MESLSKSKRQKGKLAKGKKRTVERKNDAGVVQAPAMRKKEDESASVGARNPNSLPPGLPKHWPHSNAEDLAERPVRYIEIGRPQHFWYAPNYVQTSRFTSSNFLPLFLLEEFDWRHKPANVYFLFIAVLQMVPSLSETYGVPTTLIPLSFIFLIDATLLYIEDKRRKESDGIANATPINIFNAKVRVLFYSIVIPSFFSCL